MNRITISVIAGLAIIGGAIFIARGNLTGGAQAPSYTATVVDGKQVIEISAKGGYSPRVAIAKADLPTVLKITTQGTFDCSSAVSIPKLGYRANLPPSGVTEIEVPPQKSGSTLQGLCAMGMYNFQVRFN